MMLVPSTDGVVVALHDLGGTGPPLLLAHATGFHGRVFAPLAEHLRERFHSWAIDFRGHGESRTPLDIDFQWSGLADDVIAAVAFGDAPVYGFGHSSGGAALLMAAARSPELLQSAFCFEPILWPDPGAARPRAQQLAEGARRRRATFPTRADAYDNYASKPPFSWLDDSVLRAYVVDGFAIRDDGTVGLRCAPEVEAQIYLQGAANDAFGGLGRVTCPVAVARGTERGALEREIVEAQAAALPKGSLAEFPGLGHFGPLEDPRTVADAVLRAFGP
ncbi:MAG TPA: alpha/beta hydrolase [Acidimicrobiales bacterium]|nr:alpha/beta hydrolase [Acidimicrobiales bacterium]